MVGNVFGIVFNAIDKTGFATPHKRQSEYIHTRRLNDTTVVLNVAFLVQNRNVEPTVIRPESGRPDNCID
jgi:hypothetical protein